MTPSLISGLLLVAVLSSVSVYSQSNACEQLRVRPGIAPRVDPVDANASAEELETRGDELRAEKQYFDALDHYRAALAKNPSSAVLKNKMGISELLSQRFRDARSDFEHAIKLDRRYAAAYNNLGVLDYARKKFGKAVKDYEKAIALEANDAAYYSNVGTAYFSKKDWQKASENYNRALALDPYVFDRNNRAGVAGQIASPQDRAHFSYVLAKLYARKGLAEQSLECLRRAMEEGYRDVNQAYSDADFGELRKDPRFMQLMAVRPPAIPD